MEKSTGELSLLSFQLLDLIHQAIDPVLDLLSSSLVLARSGLSADVGHFEGIDVVIEFGLDHVSEILVVKFFDVAGFGTLDGVVVEIDLDFAVVVVIENVVVYFLARLFCVLFHFDFSFVLSVA